MRSDTEENVSKIDFDLLLKRAKLAFLTLKNEFSKGKYDKVSNYVGDELWEQLNYELESNKRENFIINYEDLIVKKVSVKKKAVENKVNNVYIEIVAFSTRYKTDINTKSIIKGSEKKGEIKEILCFSRKAGCKPANKGLIEGFCPKCGTQIKGERVSNCSKCKNELRSGEYDVVLTKILQLD